MTSQSSLTADRLSNSNAPGVWDKLWHHEHSEAKDDALLERERRHPRWRLIVRELNALFGSMEGLKTIELGSGRGDLSVLLAERGAHVTLLDASERALDQARRRFRRLGLEAEFGHDDMLGTLDPWRGRFDVASSSGVIEHFRGTDRARAVRAHSSVLKPGGLAIISVPHAWCPPYRFWKCYCELRGCWPYGVELPYTRRELVRLAKKAGFLRPQAHGMGFWQSVGDHLGKSILGWGPDWADRTSIFDHMIGSTIVLFGCTSDTK